MKLPSILAFLLMSCVLAKAQTLGPYDFSDPSQYTNNFFLSFTGGVVSVGSGTLNHTVQSAQGSVIVYDTTPDTTPTNTGFQNFTLSTNFSIAAGTTSSSVGFYFDNGGDRTNSALALFNIGASSDTLRFFTGGNMTTGTAGTQVGSTVTSNASTAYASGVTYLATLTVSYIAAGDVTATLTISDPNHVLSAFTDTQTITGIAGFTASSGEIAIRSFVGAGANPSTNSFDNLQVQSVPEPSSASLLWGGLGGAALFVLTRRNRRVLVSLN